MNFSVTSEQIIHVGIFKWIKRQKLDHCHGNPRKVQLLIAPITENKSTNNTEGPDSFFLLTEELPGLLKPTNQ